MNFRDPKAASFAAVFSGLIKKHVNFPMLILFGLLMTILYFSQTKKNLLLIIEKQNLEMEKLQFLTRKQFQDMTMKQNVLESKILEIDFTLDSLQKGNPPKRKVAAKTPEEQTLDMKINSFSLERKNFASQGTIRSKNPLRHALKTLKGVIVTGADTKYYNALINLIGSVHFWDSSRNILVFDLGLSVEQLETIIVMDRVKVEQSLIKTDLKNYAWKAQCIRRATENYGKTIWLDAGSDLRGDPVIIDKLLETEDMFFVQGQDVDMSPWSNPQTLQFFHTNKEEMKGKYSFSGNLQGYVYDSQAYWEVLLVVEKCCEMPDCIAPPSSSLSDHRYDQIAMSAAIYTNPFIQVTPHTELLAAGRDQLSEDYHKPSSHIVWSARGGTSDYIQFIKRNRVPFDAPKVTDLMPPQ
jgi:hypothetical protein